jgi:hypothetical protein
MSPGASIKIASPKEAFVNKYPIVLIGPEGKTWIFTQSQI